MAAPGHPAPTVLRATLIQAYQLSDFLSNGHDFSKNTYTPQIRQVLAYLTTIQARPEVPASSTPESSATGGRARSHSAAPLSWPSDWSIDKTALRQALKAFDRSTRHILHYVDEIRRPPSTGSTPVPSNEHQYSRLTPATATDSTNSTSETESQGRYRQSTGTTTPPLTPVYQQQLNPQPPPIMDQAQIQQMINAAVQAAIQALPCHQGPPGPTGPTGPAGTGSGSLSWQLADLGYFNPMLDKSYGKGKVVTVGKDVYYRSVILFIERIKDLASVKGAILVRSNINTCLRGTALT